jgi:hypothetical protein
MTAPGIPEQTAAPYESLAAEQRGSGLHNDNVRGIIDKTFVDCREFIESHWQPAIR